MERQDHPTGTVPPGEAPEYPAQQPYQRYGTEPAGAEPPAYVTGNAPDGTPRYSDGTPRQGDDIPRYSDGTPAYGAPAYGPGVRPAGTPPPAVPPYGTQPPAEPERPKWSTRKTATVTAVAAAAVIAIGGVAVAHSGSSSSTGTAQGGAGGTGQGGPGGGGFPGGGTAATGLTGALHGTFVTAAGDGTYVTRIMQTGQVTAAGATSVTVKSTDGYAKTYTLSGATSVDGGQAAVTDIATGNTVTVVASEAGAATTVLDQSLATTGTGPGGFPGGGTGQQGGTTGQGTTGTTS
ncbi:MAG TPA: hypothetical protein VGP36_14250 [Mycobacteriales bacterium]|jgi:hypothetical protein|nr:hypothetical protein [Mycobacteriales bacterium]